MRLSKLRVQVWGILKIYDYREVVRILCLNNLPNILNQQVESQKGTPRLENEYNITTGYTPRQTELRVADSHS
jgi:hypothetical protein